MATAKRRMEFEYEARTDQDIRKHQSASTGRSGYIAEGTKIFAPKAGSHTIRILPPTWKDKRPTQQGGWGNYFGVDVHAHYNIGVDGSSFLCLAKMGKGACAICEERKKAIDSSDDELANQLRASHRVACWVIDRNAEREGPQLFLMPHSLDGEINKRLLDKRTGDVYNVDDPKEGYDIDFEREGDGLKTKYMAVAFARKATPLSDDDEEAEAWLETVVETPVPDLLLFQDEDYLREVVGNGLSFSSDAKRGRANGKARDEEEEDRHKKRSGGRPTARDDDEEDRPRRKPSREDDDEAEEDERPAKAKSRRDEEDEEDEHPAAKAKSKARDEEDTEAEDDDGDEEKESLKDRLKRIRSKTK